VGAGPSCSVLKQIALIDCFFRYRQGEGGEPSLYFELRVNTASGQQTVLTSDDSWSVAQGPIISDSIYNGEIYDARFLFRSPTPPSLLIC